MKRVYVLAAVAVVVCAGQAPRRLSVRSMSDQFVGAWKLMSFERRTTAGEITYPMGQSPVGRLTYDGLGRMSAQLMRPDRPKFRSASSGRGALEEKIAAFDGYIAYYGTYTVNEAERTVIHHVEASLYPNWVGSDQRRLFEFSEGRLILRAVNGSGGPGTESRLVWELVR